VLVHALCVQGLAVKAMLEGERDGLLTVIATCAQGAKELRRVEGFELVAGREVQPPASVAA
jgi:hypothetical protein